MRDEDSLSRRLWRENRDLALACLEHAFVRRLGDGSLPAPSFARYVAQDAFFLEAFFRAYALAAARAENRHDIAVVFYHLMGGALDELAMHTQSAADRGIDLEPVTPLPATTTYVDLLMTTAWNRGLDEIVAVMTPCMTLYSFLGQRLATNCHEGHPYRRWIDAYSGDEMTELAGRLEKLLDELADDTAEVHRLYRRAMECEVGFFDAVYGDRDEAADLG